MKIKAIIVFLLLSYITVTSYAQQKKTELTVLSEYYFNQAPPGDSVVIFAPGIISVDSTVEHGYPSFSPDGNTVFWQSNLRHKEKETEIFLKVMRRVDGQWTEPESSPHGGMPAFSPDGNKLYFIADDTEKEKGLYFVEKQAENWTEPKSLNIIARFPELKYLYCPSITNNGTLYFFAHAEGLGTRNGFAIYRAELINGAYAKPELLPASINATDNVLNWTPFIAPDESYLLFSSNRINNQQGIFISFRRNDGTWTEAYSLGETINTNRGERFPYLSPDGKYLFFTRWFEIGNEDVMWVSANIIGEIKNTKNIKPSYSQEVNKLTFIPLDKSFIELTKKMSQQELNDEKSIKLALKGLKKHNIASYRYNLIFWKLSFHYASLEQYDKCFEILKKGQNEGLFYYLGTEEREFPSYRKEIKKFEGYESFRIKNEELKEIANKTKTTEFMVQLPKNYNQNKHYPLMLIMHGGIGNIPDLQYYYQSEKLQSEFIVVYTHGGIYYGSSSRAYERESWQNDIKNIYQQIITNYPVDATKVILAGPSAGGYRSLVLGLNNEIPAKGLLLSFAVNPRVWDSTLYIKSAERGLKVALLCGENDWAIQQQKKLGYWFDKYGITNRFVVFPEEGHGFPENWPYYLDTSLEFILKED